MTEVWDSSLAPLWNNVCHAISQTVKYYHSEKGDRICNIGDITDAVMAEVNAWCKRQPENQASHYMRENENLRTALSSIEGCCMWAFDIGDPKYYPDAWLPENRAKSYAHEINRARKYALCALFPDRAANGEFENLTTDDWCLIVDRYDNGEKNNGKS